MITLIYTICAISGGPCETHKAPWDGSLISCMMKGQTALVIELREGFRLHEWRCEGEI